MQAEHNTAAKLESVLAQVDRLLLSDFPHPASEAALKELRLMFKAQQTRLNKAIKGKNAETVAAACITSNERIRQYLPLLGFLLRSTHVRNNFEAYDPLSQLAIDLVGSECRVVLSSEWDFSPLTYPMSVSALPSYVLIGLPAPESGNALILPLAGHELGHTLWQTEGVENDCADLIDHLAREYIKSDWSHFKEAYPGNAALDVADAGLEIGDEPNLFVADVLNSTIYVASRQLEEVFCDAIGAVLFGAGYLNAFHYLLAPSEGGERSVEYPLLRSRARYLQEYSGVDTYPLFSGSYETEFRDKLPNLERGERFVTEQADRITEELSCKMYEVAKGIIAGNSDVPQPTQAGEDHIHMSFVKNFPCPDPKSLADIINAGWRYVNKNAGTFESKDRPLFEWTSELVLKTIEVLEFRRRTSQ